MIPVWESYDEGELAMIRSVLEGSGIDYLVNHDFFCSLYPGLGVAFNARTVVVHQEDWSRARTLIEWMKQDLNRQDAG
mgnify:CR=1 FL=1